MTDTIQNLRRVLPDGIANWLAGGELARVAQDNQNVHTTPVNRATEEGIRCLLAVWIPEGMTNPIKKLMGAWALDQRFSVKRTLAVCSDIEHWYSVAHCRTAPPEEPDDLYYKLTWHLVAYIERVESPEIRKEMFARYFEEAEESIGTCCAGHLARLVNVLVGFDDAFRPPVPQGELIQNRISAIHALNVSVEEKAHRANAFFDEIGLPASERVAWIEALE